MLVLVMYDINVSLNGQHRLKCVSDACMKVGRRVQNSVFECELNAAEYRKLKATLSGIIDTKLDTIRYYPLGNNYTAGEVAGISAGEDIEKSYII